MLTQLETELARARRSYHFREARLPPHAGAAIYAGKLSGSPVGAAEINALTAAL